VLQRRASNLMSFNCRGVRALIVAFVATGMKAGVLMIPLGVEMMPVLACVCDSWWVMVKENVEDGCCSGFCDTIFFALLICGELFFLGVGMLFFDN